LVFLDTCTCIRVCNVWFNNTKMKLKKCCLCKNKFSGYGNNPAPLESNNKVCCDYCNTKKVIPERIRQFKLKGDYIEK